jgi:H+/gluconate symporter-like permease
MISIITTANIKIRIITATIIALISLYIINYIALYIIKKATNYKTTPKKNKKNPKLSSGLPTKINLVNLTTNSINNLINIL